MIWFTQWRFCQFMVLCNEISDRSILYQKCLSEIHNKLNCVSWEVDTHKKMRNQSWQKNEVGYNCCLTRQPVALSVLPSIIFHSSTRFLFYRLILRLGIATFDTVKRRSRYCDAAILNITRCQTNWFNRTCVCVMVTAGQETGVGPG